MNITIYLVQTEIINKSCNLTVLLDLPSDLIRLLSYDPKLSICFLIKSMQIWWKYKYMTNVSSYSEKRRELKLQLQSFIIKEHLNYLGLLSKVVCITVLITITRSLFCYSERVSLMYLENLIRKKENRKWVRHVKWL